MIKGKSLETFKDELEHLKTEMDRVATSDQKPIYDGPINVEKYFHSKTKVLWILKEAYDRTNNGKGGFDYAQHTGQDKVYLEFLKGKKYRATWYPIIFASYGILNSFTLYDDISFIEEDHSVADILQNIAVININKLAGNTTSNHAEISRVCNQNKDLLLKQIQILQPDIIIGGGTLGYFFHLLNLDTKNKGIPSFEMEYFYDDKQIFINAKHPAYRVAGKENFVYAPYVDTIINICQHHSHKLSNIHPNSPQ